MFALGVTDPRWYHFMLENPQAGPLNFWTPTPWRPKFEAGMTFGFLVKSPYRKIGGFGSFRAYEEMGVSEAWERFRQANGVPNAQDFRARIVEFASRRSSGFIDVANPVIGCILIDDCVFLPEENMVDPAQVQLSFPSEIVKYKRFEETPDLADRLGHISDSVDFDLVDPSETDWLQRREKRRQSQAIFRDRVLRAYGRKCALTDESCATVLEAAHIQPFYSMKSNHIQNGLSLRIDLHRLFDAGLISFDDRHQVLVSSSVRSDGVRAWSGKKLKIPNNPAWQPSPKALNYHRENIFRT